MGSFDVLDGFPTGFEYSKSLPKIYYMPAYNKESYKKYLGLVDVFQMLQHIKSNSDLKLSFRGLKNEDDLEMYVSIFKNMPGNIQ